MRIGFSTASGSERDSIIGPTRESGARYRSRYCTDSTRLPGSLFDQDAAAVADGSYFRPALADDAGDWPAPAESRSFPEAQWEFGVDRPAVGLSRQVEIAFRLQHHNHLAAGTEEFIMSIVVNLAG